MKSNNRSTVLKIVAGSVVGLFLLDRVVLSPAIDHWRAQSERIALLREKVERGQQTLDREKAIRGRWADMQRANLPKDVSTAENDVFKAVGRWARDSQISFTSLTPQWQTHEEGYQTLECRMSASGDQKTLGRFVHELETDPMPVSLEECEISTRDTRGGQLTMSARFSFLRLAEGDNTSRVRGGRR